MNQGAQKLDRFLERNDDRTAAELAAKCEMQRAQLCHLRKGRRIPTLPQAFKLQKHAEIPMEAWLYVGR